MWSAENACSEKRNPEALQESLDPALEALRYLKSRGKQQIIFLVYENRMEEHSIDELDLSVRAMNCLKRAGFKTVGELVKNIDGSDDLKRFRNMGRKSAGEIMQKLYLFQYEQLKPEKRKQYLEEMLKINLMPDGKAP